MGFRISTHQNFTRLTAGLQATFARLARSQQQIASGRRILRPSDDPAGAARVLNLQRHREATRALLDTALAARPLLEGAASHLQESSELLARGRELALQGLNGTLSAADRESLAAEVEFLREQLLSQANANVAGRYLFGGTETGAAPWEELDTGTSSRVVYGGSLSEPRVPLGNGLELAVHVNGAEAFGASKPAGVVFSGGTGAAPGAKANQGTGYEYLTLKHTQTDGTALAGSGLTLASGSGADTLLGTWTLVVDGTAGTVQLGNGPAVPLPEAADPQIGNFPVENELGGVVHLDFSGYAGGDFSRQLIGAGEISIDGETFVPLDFLETDLQLAHPVTGSVVHVDTTGVGAAGEELVTFSGTVNAFDVLQGIAEDLRAADGLDAEVFSDRLGGRLAELDRNHDGVLLALTALGTRSERLADLENHLEGVVVELSSAIGALEDVDITQAVTELAEAEQTLNLIQATGVRLIQNSILNFI